jgi:colanic acid biosynthesis glycosyl transferase WcaI
LRIVVNDYSGHPFQVELSRSLARRGHNVLHVHFADFQTPKGDLVRRDDDATSFDVCGLSLGRPFAKSRYFRRLLQERRYGWQIAETAISFEPDMVIGCNNPLDAQCVLQESCRSAGVPFVFWLQDIYSFAINHVMRRKLPVLGAAVGAYYTRLERRLLRRSDAVVAITEDFIPIIIQWGVDEKRCTVIRNWAPLEAISPMDKNNAWSRAQGLVNKKVVLYSGTLGLKHDPLLLVYLAENLRSRGDTIVLVVSEGIGAEHVKNEAGKRGLENIRVLPFQPFSSYSQVLGSADILLSMIEPAAGIFSVPSKVLSYFCAGRALVLSVPKENLAAKTVVEVGAGRCVDPGDREAFCGAVINYLDSPERSLADGRKGRTYAENTFAIEAITDRFEAVLSVAGRMTGTRCKVSRDSPTQMVRAAVSARARHDRRGPASALDG